ncbi:hypothetical protein [Shimia abyssi]|uniref:Uncharacterized protein n=1 Tax=Shimia abyssi TaxID=1662395 RepID=A0A2P8FEI0_9RHOB|nr:hypothetical protein [Shimia abyssi]PSL20130.1 hypothetical protein CLV88_104191 [Shimia abyssi]
MNLENLIERVTVEMDKALSDLPGDEKAEILGIVKKAMLDTSHRTHRELKETAVVCCGPEADLVHKLQEQMDQKRDMLIANLSAMR